MRQLLAVWIAAVVCVTLCPHTLYAATRNWGGSTGGDWFTAGNWTEVAVPGNGDVVVVNAGSILLTNATAQLSSFAITNASVTFTNWATSLNATNVSIGNGATVTHVSNSDTNAPWVADARVYIACSNLIVEVGGSIDASEKGYQHDGTTQSTYGYGSGGGQSAGGTYRPGGGGHGGRGGDGATGKAGGTSHGSISMPQTPGSGGGTAGGGPYNAGEGGGVVRIEAAGKVTVNGTIAADGQVPAGNGGGGAGGSIYITCDAFDAAGGTIRSDGANPARPDRQGEGGGGRIALVYNSAVGTPNVTFSAKPGSVLFTSSTRAKPGTLYLSDDSFFPPSSIVNSYQFYIVGFTNWAPDSLTVDGAAVGLLNMPLELAPTNNLKVNNGTLWLHETIVRAGGSIILTNGSDMHVFSGGTNDTTPAYGALISATYAIDIRTNCTLYLYSENTNGGSVRLTAGEVTVAGGGSINVDGLGFKAGEPGHTTGYGKGGGPLHGGYRGGGAGYGGHGGRSLVNTTYGGTYGSSNAPALPGSGGSASTSTGTGTGHGGGLIYMDIANTVTVDGTLTADGRNFGQGAGSGGGIFVICKEFLGAGAISADGGNCTDGSLRSGGGGGGRIAVWEVAVDADRARILGGDFKRTTIGTNNVGFTGSTSVEPGASYNSGDPTESSQPGTIVFLFSPPPGGTIITIR